ncbi:GNAT family N-acetyltransferase [Reinekea marinisedimentorum]|uniref:Acetyltransferase (GNAT) family protein n=1 Tax=Reinekea marinisedimentorum TaxID=230495 RepID=A0A4R3HZS3_9GAMM|nr:GNAT family N-acetyltransferase [Reinekea marinisedimentorum]TCS38758.1 acetyltransferase (GNAT) family protein [Reinekea marinisedimentorum]
MTIFIRLAKSEGAQGLSDLNYMFNRVRVSATHVVRSLERNLSEKVFVALVNDELAGFACIDVKHSFCYETADAELTEIFAIDQFRGFGVATSLVNEVVKYCVVNEFDELYLRTSPTNDAANLLFINLDFKLGETNVYYALK